MIKNTLKIQSSQGLNGTVRLPGDKSISHRVLLLGSLASGTSDFRNVLEANVTTAMLNCLRALGVVIELSNRQQGTATIRIQGKGLHLSPPTESLYCMGSATTMRLLAGILSAQKFESVLDGNQRLRQRPMNRVIKPLAQMGAGIESNAGCAPLKFSPAVLNGAECRLNVASAQVKSAIMLAGLFAEGETKVVEPSVSRDHTERLFRHLGLPIDEVVQPDGSHIIRVHGPIKNIPAMSMDLPGDPSSAAFLIIAALVIEKSSLVIENCCLNSGRVGLLDVLRSMGADIIISDETIKYGEPVGSISVKSCGLSGVNVLGSIIPKMIDEFPIFAVAATQTSGETRVSDAEELRYKESDRIEAVAEELNKMGAGIVTTKDGFIINGPVKLKGARVDGRGDHRLAMSLVVAGLIAQGETIVDNCEIINDSFPNFVSLLNLLGANIS